VFRRAFFLCECFCLTVKNSFRAREPRARHVSRARDFNIKPYTALSNYSIQRVTPPPRAGSAVVRDDAAPSAWSVFVSQHAVALPLGMPLGLWVAHPLSQTDLLKELS
jgi:hypothetical protein